MIMSVLPRELLLHICSLVLKSDAQLILALRLTCRMFYDAVMSRVNQAVSSSLDTMLACDDIISVLDWVHYTLSRGPSGISQMMTYASRWLRTITTEIVHTLMQHHFTSLVFMNNITQLLCVPDVTSDDLIQRYNQTLWDAGIALDEPRMFGMLAGRRDYDTYNSIVDVCESRKCVRIYLYYHRVDEASDDDVMYMLDELADEHHRYEMCDHERAQGCVNIVKSLLTLRPHLILREDFDEFMGLGEFKQLCMCDLQ